MKTLIVQKKKKQEKLSKEKMNKIESEERNEDKEVFSVLMVLGE